MKQENRDRFSSLMGMIQDPTRKEQVRRLCEYLNQYTQYFTGPASCKYHCSYPEGLLEHSLNVAENALHLLDALPGTGRINREEVIVAALFHDLGKSLLSDGIPHYTKNEQTDKQKAAGYVSYPPYNTNDEGCVYFTVPQMSVRLLTQFVDISDMCYQAILIHDGQYVNENKPYACKENPMALILHYSDSWAGFTMEGKTGKSEDGKAYILLPPDDRVGVNGANIRVSRTRE